MPRVVYGSTVSDPDGRTFTAAFNFGFSTEIMTGTLNLNGHLMTINQYAAFAPGDGRDHDHRSNTLVRNR